MGLSEWVETAVDSTTSRMEGVREIGEETELETAERMENSTAMVGVYQCLVVLDKEGEEGKAKG